MTGVLIDNGAAARKLAASDPVLAGIIKGVGPCPLTPTPNVELFQALLRSIIYQQLHGKAAAAIHGRVVKLMPDVNAAALETLPDAALRAAGHASGRHGSCLS